MLTTLLMVAALASQTASDAYRPGNGITNPRLQHDVKPQYTADAMRRKVEGVVFLECVVEIDGTPSSIRVTKPLDPELDAQAVKALQEWRFLPGTKDGQPVRVIIRTEMSFVLRPPGTPVSPNAPIVITSVRQRDGSTTSFEITQERFRQLPVWNPLTAANPPFAIGDAIAKAREWLNTTKPRGDAGSYAMISTVMSRAAGTNDRWCYQVNFQPLASGDVRMEGGLIPVIVLFDGSIVEPRVTQP